MPATWSPAPSGISGLAFPAEQQAREGTSDGYNGTGGLPGSGPAAGVHPWRGAAALVSESALILRDLNQLDAALAQAQAAVALRESRRARSLALSRITLVDIHVLRGDLDAAVQTGHGLLSTSPTLGSVRVVQQLDALRQLLEPHRAYGPMRQYLTRFDDARRARMLLLADIIASSPGGTPA
ncbi:MULTISPECIES: hypothetical protein [unclassified Streptomyces]|uniref:hypothetical protein n=1 Tax=unclassified Streptomyces TaxID=2593676 RepID=UPI0022548ADA|nr:MULTISPECIES: hypothetical protein [unclassified Streptomyces]MCX4649278.1 hypothetical protein [Streptomyces sp. NBC_01446]MCX5321511.1 hypothetical protein [Streptomyces sp. NBC_00120]